MKKAPSEEQIRARLRELTEEARRSRTELTRPRRKRIHFEPRSKASDGPRRPAPRDDPDRD